MKNFWRFLTLLFWAPLYFCLSGPYMYWSKKREEARRKRSDYYGDPNIPIPLPKAGEALDFPIVTDEYKPTLGEYLKDRICLLLFGIFYLLFIVPHEVYTGECYWDRGW